MFTGGKKERADSDLINIREETPNCHEYFFFLELHLSRISSRDRRGDKTTIQTSMHWHRIRTESNEVNSSN